MARKDDIEVRLRAVKYSQMKPLYSVRSRDLRAVKSALYMHTVCCNTLFSTLNLMYRLYIACLNVFQCCVNVMVFILYSMWEYQSATLGDDYHTATSATVK